MGKRSNEWIRDHEGRGQLVKAYRLGELMVHRTVDRVTADGEVSYRPHGWTVSHCRTGAAVAKLKNVNHKQAMATAREMESAASKIWPRIRYNDETGKAGPVAAIKAANELTYDIRSQLAQKGQI